MRLRVLFTLICFSATASVPLTDEVRRQLIQQHFGDPSSPQAIQQLKDRYNDSAVALKAWQGLSEAYEQAGMSKAEAAREAEKDARAFEPLMNPCGPALPKEDFEATRDKKTEDLDRKIKNAQKKLDQNSGSEGGSQNTAQSGSQQGSGSQIDAAKREKAQKDLDLANIEKDLLKEGMYPCTNGVNTALGIHQEAARIAAEAGTKPPADPKPSTPPTKPTETPKTPEKPPEKPTEKPSEPKAPPTKVGDEKPPGSPPGHETVRNEPPRLGPPSVVHPEEDGPDYSFSNDGAKHFNRGLAGNPSGGASSPIAEVGAETRVESIEVVKKALDEKLFANTLTPQVADQILQRVQTALRTEPDLGRAIAQVQQEFQQDLGSKALTPSYNPTSSNEIPAKEKLEFNEQIKFSKSNAPLIPAPAAPDSAQSAPVVARGIASVASPFLAPIPNPFAPKIKPAPAPPAVASSAPTIQSAVASAVAKEPEKTEITQVDATVKSKEKTANPVDIQSGLNRLIEEFRNSKKHAASARVPASLNLDKAETHESWWQLAGWGASAPESSTEIWIGGALICFAIGFGIPLLVASAVQKRRQRN